MSQSNELWYEAELKRPPLVTVDVPDAKFVEKLHVTITSCIRSNGADSTEFAQTAALLSRLIARRKNSFRRMIGFRNLLKLNTLNCRLLRLDLPRDIELFCGALPDIVYGENSSAALPTKNCLDFVLVRLLSAYHIRQRIHDCTVTAADYFLELLRANNYVDFTTLLLAVIGKLRSINARLANRCIDLYHKMLKYRLLFPTGNGKSLVPDTMELPEKLQHFELPILEPEENHAEVTVVVSTAVTTNVSKIKKRVDVGIELERTKSTAKKTKGQFRLDQLKTVEDVKRFIIAENKARKKSPKSCIGHRISDDKWTGVQKIFERKIQAGETKKALSIFLNFLNVNL